MCDWLRVVWGRRPGALLRLPAMLVPDAFRGHLTADVKAVIQELRSKLVVIPGGMTSVLQPLDVSINKPFKAAVQDLYDKWLSRDDLPLTPTGKFKQASPFVVAGWVKNAWDRVSADIISKSFRKSCLSNASDGTEDDDLWQDDPDDPPAESDAADSDDSSMSRSDSDSGPEDTDDEDED